MIICFHLYYYIRKRMSTVKNCNFSCTCNRDECDRKHYIEDPDDRATVKDIYEEFDMKITPRKKEDIRKNLSEDEKPIFDILHKNPKTIDDLAIELELTVSEVLNIISVLEINGVVEKNMEHKYQIKI